MPDGRRRIRQRAVAHGCACVAARIRMGVEAVLANRRFGRGHRIDRRASLPFQTPAPTCLPLEHTVGGIRGIQEFTRLQRRRRDAQARERRPHAALAKAQLARRQRGVAPHGDLFRRQRIVAVEPHLVARADNREVMPFAVGKAVDVRVGDGRPRGRVPRAARLARVRQLDHVRGRDVQRELRVGRVAVLVEDVIQDLLPFGPRELDEPLARPR